ncbi:MAG: FGGY-family carbohydrate kinase [Oscillospiraceae bacterium]|nr:FGGY-family carbohydrate kinase [Oscillospiraceae bacterium]
MKKYLGIELGSTRIKAVLIGENFVPIASGAHDWENRLEDGIWTYRLEDAWAGIRDSFAKLSADYQSSFGEPLTDIDGMGVSAMMHGYLPFGKNCEQLVPFRSWRNTVTEKAAEVLSDTFNFNIPQRFSIAHLYQAILNNEPHVKDIAFITTLAGCIHWKLTGQNVLGLNEASGVFPVDNGDYDPKLIARFNELLEGFNCFKLQDVLPKAIPAGGSGGVLTAEGAKLLDPTGRLKAGIPMCPPEGDAGTGMVATNSIAERTGSVSAGTSSFAMLILEKPLSKRHMEIDLMATPAGKPVAMAHASTCTTDLDAWVGLFGEVLETMGTKADKSDLYYTLYNKALEGDTDCGGLLSYNFYAGETVVNMNEGRPLFVRNPDSRLTLANFMRAQLYAAMTTLKLGMDILTEQEGVRIEQLVGHGGLFKTKGVAQRLMAAALNVTVAVMETAGEGGAWGIALLAAYMAEKDGTLEEFLSKRVFSNAKSESIAPNIGDTRGFNAFMERYNAGLPIERAAVECLNATL